jgi:hypothetical protein
MTRLVSTVIFLLLIWTGSLVNAGGQTQAPTTHHPTTRAATTHAATTHAATTQAATTHAATTAVATGGVITGPVITTHAATTQAPTTQAATTHAATTQAATTHAATTHAATTHAATTHAATTHAATTHAATTQAATTRAATTAAATTRAATTAAATTQAATTRAATTQAATTQAATTQAATTQAATTQAATTRAATTQAATTQAATTAALTGSVVTGVVTTGAATTQAATTQAQTTGLPPCAVTTQAATTQQQETTRAATSTSGAVTGSVITGPVLTGAVSTGSATTGEFDSDADLFSTVEVITPPGTNFTKGSISGRIMALGDAQHDVVFIFERIGGLTTAFNLTVVLNATTNGTLLMGSNGTVGENVTTSDFGFAVRLFTMNVTANTTSAILAVGAPGLDNNTGAVFIYRRNNSTSWSLVARLNASVPLVGGRFGSALSFGDNVTLLIGAPGDGLVLNGSAYVFKLINGSWIQVSVLQANDTAVGDEFGYSVSAADANLFVIGAPQHANFTGAAYIFVNLNPSANLTVNSTLNYTETVKLMPPRSTFRFGQSVAMSEFLAAVISSPNRSAIAAVDQVHTYGRNVTGVGKWGFIQSLDIDAQNAPAGGEESLALSEDVIAVGMPAFGLNTGAVLVFRTSPELLSTTVAPTFGLSKVVMGPDTRPTSRFGFSVDLNGEAQMLVTSSVSAYVFSSPHAVVGVTLGE